MAYTVHNFEQGDVLYAQQLNEMDTQIALNEENITNGVSFDMLAEDYSANKTYSIGDYVVYNNELYTCIYEISAPEGWNSAHWEITNLGDSISDLKSKINDIVSISTGKNLYDGQYEEGYRSGLNIAGTTGDYSYTKPIYLDSGNYLFTGTEAFFGEDNGRRVFFVNEAGVCSSYSTGSVVGTKTESGKYNARPIIGFSLSNPTYVSFNIGTKGNPNTVVYQPSNFMLVKGVTIDDFPDYEEYIPPYVVMNPDILPMETVNGLSGLFFKTAVFDGDSICHGTSVGETDPSYGDGWAGRIGKANFMEWKNYGINGGIITSASASGASGKHSVVDNIDTIYASYPNADFVVFEGGTNDADMSLSIGSFTPDDFTGTYDVTTFCGALETIFYKATNYWKGKSIGFIIAHKMGVGSYGNRKTYFDKAKEICQKWGIPYCNLWDDCYLNANNPNCYNSSLTVAENIAQGFLYTDGQHLTAKGYDYISPIIEDWMKSI